MQQEFGLLDWNYSDLRILDPPDSAQPNLDLIAAYTRMNGQYFQMRLDFLGLRDSYSQDIYILIDTQAGGTTKIVTENQSALTTDLAWDYLIELSSSGNVDILDNQLAPVTGASLLVVRDRTQDRLILSLNRAAVPIMSGKTHFQVMVTPAHQSNIVNKSTVFSMDTPAPPRLKVVFTFWNTFNPSTPATTLRSWAGAHTGPGRSRHGLRYLLESAAQTKTTLFLFGVTQPTTLSALDYIGGLPLLQGMAEQGNLVLLSFAEPGKKNPSTHVSEAVLRSNLPNGFLIQGNINDYLNTDPIKQNSNFIWLMNSLVKNSSFGYIFGGNDYAHYINFRCPLVANSSSSNDNIVDIIVECKRAFVQSALEQPTLPLVMGGDFHDSILGDPTTSLEVFAYVNSHPWLQVLNKNDLATNLSALSPGQPHYSASKSIINSNAATQPGVPALAASESKILHSLENAPDNQISQLAWQVFQDLTSTSSPELEAVKANYLGQIEELLRAANWAESPAPMSSCAEDLDADGTKECILANQTIFTIVEPDGGYIPFVFARDQRGLHQIVGPTWEFLVGLSDPSTWDATRGVRSDPDQILGAFADPIDKWNLYNVLLEGTIINLYSSDMTMRKSLTILPGALHFEIQNQSASANHLSIPLVLDPWIRFTPGWSNLYSGSQSQTEFTWEIKSDISIAIRSTTPMEAFPFNATRAAMSSPENPNFDYSPGHYLPYPMALVQLNPGETLAVDISIKP